jgi:fructokinase
MRIGVDLGGTKIEAIGLDEKGRILARGRVETPRDDYEATLEAIAGLVTEIEAEAQTRGTVGVGMPGAISPASGLVKNANSVWLNGQPIAEDLARLVPRPLRFANDANCLILSEARDGAAGGAQAAFGVIVGTGTGGGLFLHGHVWAGANAVAGEWGHNPLPWRGPEEWPGPPCYCGRNGCIETYLSGPGFARDYARAAGRRADPPDIVARAAKGEAEAETCLKRYEDRMARALAHVINVLDPEVIVLGGGMSNIERLYDEVPRLWSRWVFTDQVVTRLVPALHGDSSGVRGAAWLWDDSSTPEP